MNHRADAHFGGIVDAIAEWEEGVRSHNGAFHFQVGVLSFNGGDTRGVHAAHLASANTNSATVFGVDDGVGFHHFGNLPGKQQLVHLLIARLNFGDDFQITLADHAVVFFLNQQAAVNAFVVQSNGAFGAPLAAFQQAYVFLGGNGFGGFGGDAWCNDDFGELLVDNQLRGVGIQLAVEGDDTAKGGFRIGCKSQLVSGLDVSRYRNATGVGVLNDDASGLVKQFDGFQCSVGIGNVVEGQLFALQLLGGRDRGFSSVGFYVEGGFLMRVFAVAHVLSLNVLNVISVGEVALVVAGVAGAKVVGDHAIVLGGMFERLHHQIVTGVVAGGAAVGLHFGDDGVVARSVNHNGHVFVVFRGGAHHGRTADVDVFDSGGQITVRIGNGCFERIQVNNNHVDGFDAVLGHYRIVGTATTQDATVYFGVQGLNAAVHHFREASVVGYFHGVDAVFGEQAEGAACGEDFNALCAQRLGKFNDTGFV